MTPQQPTTTEAGKRLLDDCIETAWPRDAKGYGIKTIDGKNESDGWAAQEATDGER